MCKLSLVRYRYCHRVKVRQALGNAPQIVKHLPLNDSRHLPELIDDVCRPLVSSQSLSVVSFNQIVEGKPEFI